MKSKLLSVLLSLAIAFGLWMYVITVVSPGSEATFNNIPVSLEGAAALEERGLMITSGADQTIHLRLSGNRSDLNELTSANIVLRADVSKIYEAGQAQVPYTTTFPSNVANNAVNVESRSSNYITLTVENRIRREIPVEVAYNGELDNNYMTDRENAVLDYSTVSVSGPESVVSTIAKARIEVDLTERTESISETYRYTLCDAENNPVDARLIKVNTEEVRLELKILRVKEVRLAVTVVDGGGATSKNAGIEIDPRSIRVCGSDAVLESLYEINLGTINLGDITKAVSIPFAISLPEGVTNLTGVQEATVHLTFSGVITKDFAIRNITAVNVPEGMEAEIITEVLTVTVRGTPDKVNAMTENDIAVTVDFSGLEAGTFTMKANVTISSDFPDVGQIGQSSVSASLSAEE